MSTVMERPNPATASDFEWAMWVHRDPSNVETHLPESCPVCTGEL